MNESHRQDDYGSSVFLKSSLMIVFFAALNAAVKWELQESKVKDMM